MTVVKKATKKTAAKKAAKKPKVSLDLGDTYGGVSTTWLGHIFGFDKGTVAKRLAAAGVTPIGTRRGGNLYSIKEAAPHLVTPKIDLVQYIQSLRPNDLPPILNSAYWDAMLKRQKWMANAGELWHTEDVMSVLGDLAMQLKSTITLWVEEVDRKEGLTGGQRKVVEELSDNLLERIHDMLVEAPLKKETVSSINEEGATPPGVILEEETE